jgi:tetratricopeptide (TPR) repeat protein
MCQSGRNLPADSYLSTETRLIAAEEVSAMKSFFLFLVLLIFSENSPGQTEPAIAVESLAQLSQHGDYVRLVEVARSRADDPQRSAAERGLACIYVGFGLQELSRYAEAVTAYERSFQLLEHHAETARDYAVAMTALATLYIDLGEREEARPLLNKSLRLYEGKGDHSGLAIVWMNLASLASKSNSERETRKSLEHAKEESQRVHGLGNDYQASIASAEAWLALRRRDASAAIDGYQHCLDLLLPVHGAQHPLIGHTYMEIGKAYLAKGDTARGEENMRRGLGILKAALGDSHPQYLMGEVMYAQLLDTRGAHAEASNLRTQAKSALSVFQHAQCAQCRVSVAALERGRD